MNAILAIAGADAAERTRRFAFLLTIAAALYAGYVYVPDAHATYRTVLIANHPGIYNSAFIGATIAVLTSAFLTLVGFFLVRGALERDAEFNVDGIVCASPVRKLTFVLAKWLSNWAVLSAVAGVSYAAAVAIQLLRAQVRHVDMLAYLLPYVLISVPAMALVAAIAILFDVIRPLRGLLGGCVFVFSWGFMLSSPAFHANGELFDPLGVALVANNLLASVQQTFPHATASDVNMGIIGVSHKTGAPFIFSGIRWTGAVLAQRLAWLGLAIALVIAVSGAFDRYRREAARGKRAFFIDVTRLIPNVPALRIFRAEFGLIANGANLWWYAGAIALIVASAVAPPDAVARFVLPVLLIWPLERISALGARERRYGVDGLVAAAPGYATKTMLVQWLAGSSIAVLLASGYIARLALDGNGFGIVACIAVAAAMSGAALALGSAFGASRVFESAYLVLWYLGPIQHLGGVDFAGAMTGAPIVLTIVCAFVTLVSLAGTRTARLAR